MPDALEKVALLLLGSTIARAHPHAAGARKRNGPRAAQAAQALGRGRGEPIAHDRGLYKRRDRVERLTGKLKQLRRAATRHEKLAVTFAALVHLSLTLIAIR